MSLDDDEKMILYQLQQWYRLPLHWRMNFTPTDEGFLERLDILEKAEGKLVDRKPYRKIRKILKSGKIKEKRGFLIASLPPQMPGQEDIRRIFEGIPDKLVNVAFRFIALVVLAANREARIRYAAMQRGIGTQITKSTSRERAISSGISEIAKALESDPENKDLWGKLAVFLDNLRKDYLAQAAQSMVFKNPDVHVRSKRELAKLLIVHRAPKAAEKVLDGATLDPFA